jgi:hypothetical protein
MDYLKAPSPVPDPHYRIRRWLAAAMSAAFVVAQVSPAYATIDNTATATGSSPTGTNDVTDSDTENVDVINAAPVISVVKTHVLTTDLNGDNNVDIGDVITYTYVVTNTGNVTLQNATLSDAHDGVGSLTFTTPVTYTDNGTNPGGPTGTLSDSSNVDFTDGDWDVLGPKDVITWTATYTVQAGDFTAGSSADGDIDNTATPGASYNASPLAGAQVVEDSDFVPIDSTARFDLVKVADDTTDRDVGDIVTYTYTITNTGNVPITNVTLADVENGSGALVGPAFDSWTTQNSSTVSGNTLTLFNPGAVAVYESTYQVTQNDVDTLQ